MLVPVPWQPALYVHADLLVKLEQVQARIGRPPMLYSALSGWRSYEQQKQLWLAFLAGGNPASNPDTGNRTHMRGVAVDLADQSQAMQNACRVVGLERDPAEAWHWQLPNWRSYPIISALEQPIDEEEDDDMKPVAFQRTSGGKEWLLAAPWLVGTDALQQGYIVTIDEAKGIAWLRMYARGSGSNAVDRAGYMAIQDAARELRKQWIANGVPASAGGNVADIGPVLDAVAAVPSKTVNELKDRL